MKCCRGCCGCCPDNFKKEFQRKNFGLNFPNPSCFYCCQFRIPFVAFFILKAALAIYTLTWLIIFVKPMLKGETMKFDGQNIFVFLTSWTYILLVIYLWTSLVDVVYMTFKHVRNGDLRSLKVRLSHHRPTEGTANQNQGAEAREVEWRATDDPEASTELLSDYDDNNDNPINLEEERMETHEHTQIRGFDMTWYHKMVWLLHDVTSGIVPMVTLIYFALIYPYELKYMPSSFVGSSSDINLHGITSVIVLLDNTLSSIPVRILHVIYPITFGLIYVAFSLIYYAVDTQNNIPYPKLLDWRQPGTTIAVILIISLVLMPLIQLVWYGWYRLKLWVFRKVHGYSYEESSQVTNFQITQLSATASNQNI